MDIVRMDTARHILELKGQQIWSVSPDDTVFEALRRMALKDVGALVVYDQDENLVGIISERDYARKIILQGRTSRDTLVRDIMTTEVITVHPSQTVEEVMELMTNHHIRHLPVVEDGKVIGVVSIGDALRNMLYRTREIMRSMEKDCR